jgi:hypothetical protein
MNDESLLACTVAKKRQTIGIYSTIISANNFEPIKVCLLEPSKMSHRV